MTSSTSEVVRPSLQPRNDTQTTEGKHMTFTETRAASQNSEFAPQIRHRAAAGMHEKAVKHHRQAALLHDLGDKEQALTHANIARRHAISALAACDVSPYI
jgi:hypothetical protein